MWLAFLIPGSVPAASLLWPFLSLPLAAYVVALLCSNRISRVVLS
jgi:hypothetical protein